MDSTDVNQAVGARIKAIRAARRMRQADLAAAVGVTSGRLSQLDGGAAWSLEQVVSAARALQVPVASVIVDDGVPDLGPIYPPEVMRVADLVLAGDWLGAYDAIGELRRRK